MGLSVEAAGRRGVTAAVVSDKSAMTTRVVMLLDTLKKAVKQAGFNVDDIAVLMKTDRNNLHKQVNGDRTMSMERLAEFPDDVLGEFGALLAREAGHIVVQPAASQNEAREFLVRGLVALLTGAALPVRAEHMAKADMPSRGEERRRA